MLLSSLVPSLLVSNGFSQAEPGPTIKKPLIYQVGQMVHINAAGSRPLLQAVDALQQKYGWTVDYEDAQYPPPTDGATNQLSPPLRRRPNAAQIRDSGFSVEFNTGPTSNSRPDEDTVLALVVDANNQSNDAGQFELRKVKDGSFAIVGVGVRDSQGQSAYQQPILDTPISLASERRSARETITLICQKLSEQIKIPVVVNDASESVPGRETVAIGGTAVSTRTLLSRTLASMGSNFYWRLIYDSSNKSYEFSVDRLSP
jgi:hypothetical protein